MGTMNEQRLLVLCDQLANELRHAADQAGNRGDAYTRAQSVLHAYEVERARYPRETLAEGAAAFSTEVPG